MICFVHLQCQRMQLYTIPRIWPSLRATTKESHGAMSPKSLSAQYVWWVWQAKSMCSSNNQKQNRKRVHELEWWLHFAFAQTMKCYLMDRIVLWFFSWRTNSVAALTSLANPCCQRNLFKRHRKHCPSMHEVRSNMGRYRIRYATRLKCTGVCCWHVLWNIEQHRPHIMSYFRPILQSPAAFFQHFQPYKCFTQNVAKTTRWTLSMIKPIRT